ncbi:hypothetical protein L6164_008646 [Bauhinia variegata]|uniref:Uncharacterized protein n=1 Tax=Bauhinia variegata TaxID=167791 RepID=A0ACB9PIN4_BAUVA|nr:hypothetical protein L6164_008646 [Bauhinia variegata]
MDFLVLIFLFVLMKFYLNLFVKLGMLSSLGKHLMECGSLVSLMKKELNISLHELDAQGLASKILPPAITKVDFDEILAKQKQTVSKADLEVHERFTQEFGEEG